MSDLSQYNNGAGFDSAPPAPANFGPIPPNEYPVEISAACVKPTRAGDGAYVEFEFTIIGAESNGRRLWHRCNIQNKNPRAVEIGKEQLNQVREAAGIVSLTDTEQMVGRRIIAKVIIKEDRNEVKYVKELEAQPAQPVTQAPPAPAPVAPPVAQPQAAPPAPMPWQQPTAPAPPPQGGQYDNVAF